MVVFGGLSFLGLAFSIPFESPLRSLNILGRDLITVLFGVIAIIGSRQADKLGWAIALIIVGYLGGGIGGLLVLVGGILGLIAYFYKHS